MSDNNNVSFNAFMPVIIIFLITITASILLKDQLTSWSVNQPLLLYGNVLLFAVTLASWFFHRSAINAGNTQAFLRNVYSAMLLKLFVCIIVFFIYVSVIGSNAVNKAALFSVMFLYLVYTFTELSILIKQSNKKRNSNG